MKQLLLVFLFLVILSCSNTEESYSPISAPLDIPEVFENNILPPVIPLDNPQTEEGIALGRRLFFDRILSGDGSQSCASCHQPQLAFSDDNPTSRGIEGELGTRNTMPIFNLAWNYSERFAWDGKELSLERQVLEPVSNPIEMNSDWDEVIDRLNAHPDYPTLFNQAFPNEPISADLVTKAIAQFERTLISANSKFDRYLLGEVSLTANEENGLNVFMDEARGDCFHCHGSPNNPLWTDNDFHNNGLDATFTDLGLGAITGDPTDNGKFRSPSLRNLAYTAPYMHDGRFDSLEEVIDFYSEGLQASPTIDPLMKKIDQGGVQLTDQDKADLIAFLLTLTDPSFLETQGPPN
ncbi:cytochrome-c peroxidase [Winogradskyella aurantiaca]|uniref:cytochrome-c peroxidase n=1 Tax=Winogradskyella aurantiaca TaxID=2219558 RepID=UPI0018E576C6|nr:cytochrome c peroxidase [Winogradskyella aurantiaca]